MGGKGRSDISYIGEVNVANHKGELGKEIDISLGGKSNS